LQQKVACCSRVTKKLTVNLFELELSSLLQGIHVTR